MSVSPRELAEFLAQEALPASYVTQAQRYFLPFLEGVHQAVLNGRLRVLGIHGAQGSGKSTLAALIAWYFQHQPGLRVVQLSLDDFYYPSDHRRDLAKRVHPLFATRGVPGTHDCALALATLRRLRELGAAESCRLPRFDKAVDDRVPQSQWTEVTGPVDLIVFEGWCVGAVPETEAALARAVNQLEAVDDADGSWRRRVNDHLGGDYQNLFAELDYLLMLKAPNFDCVAGWRLQQEEKLATRRRGDALMDAAAVGRFVQFYQRITCHCLGELPQRADCVMEMDAERRISGVMYNRELSDV